MVDFRRNSPLQAFLAGEEAADASAARDIKLERSRLALGTEQQQVGQNQETRKIQFMNRAASALLQLPDEQFQAAFQRLAPAAKQAGIDPAQFSPDQLTRQNLESLKTQTGEFLRDPNTLNNALSSAERLRESQIRDLKGDDPVRREFTRVQTGLDPRAVGSASQTITERGTAEDVGDTEAVIAERKKFGELTGSSRNKAIDKGFDAIQGINQNVRNIDRAIAQIDEGASTGAIESRFFPSLKKATVALENIQSELALDVIGSVTFGALSQGELDLARQVALPTGLQPAELKQFLQDKKVAQEKLRAYYEEQVDFLDQGGSVAGFLRSKRRGTTQNASTETTATQAFFSDSLQREVTEQDIADTLEANPGVTREQLFQQLGIR